MLPPKFSFDLDSLFTMHKSRLCVGGLCHGKSGLKAAGKGLPSVDFCICLSGTCLFYNSGMTFFLESKYVFVLTLTPG